MHTQPVHRHPLHGHHTTCARAHLLRRGSIWGHCLGQRVQHSEIERQDEVIRRQAGACVCTRLQCGCVGGPAALTPRWQQAVGGREGRACKRGRHGGEHARAAGRRGEQSRIQARAIASCSQCRAARCAHLLHHFFCATRTHQTRARPAQRAPLPQPTRTRTNQASTACAAYRVAATSRSTPTKHARWDGQRL